MCHLYPARGHSNRRAFRSNTTAFSSAFTSSSRCVSSRCKVRHRPAAAGQPERHVAVVRRAGDVQGHPVDRDRQRVGAEQLGAVPVVRGPRAGHVADDQVVRRPHDALHPQDRPEDGRRLANALIAMICTGVIDDSARLPSTIERWTRARRSAGSGRSVASWTITAPTALPPSTAIWDCLAEADRDHGHQRRVGQRVEARAGRSASHRCTSRARRR